MALIEDKDLIGQKVDNENGHLLLLSILGKELDIPLM